MANTDAAFGLRPVRYFSSGKPYTGAANPYFATGATGVIAPGDPVAAGGTANSAAFGGYEAGFLPTCILATAGDGNSILGVCVAVLPVTRESTTYRADSTDRIIMVADDPDLVFQAQADDDATAWAVTDARQFANLASATADTTLGISRWELDGSDAPAADYSNQVMLLNLARTPGNEVGAFGVWEVIINQHQMTPGVLNSDMGRVEAA